MAFMPWNYDMVQRLYPSIGDGFIHRMDDRFNVNPPAVANEIRRIVRAENADPNSDSTVSRAREATKDAKGSWIPYLSPVFGYLSQWLSEIGGPDDLNKLLRHADTYLNPSWSNGGLYYKRCDKGWDEKGNYTFVDPYTSNGGIAYARLNVKNGQKKMWDHPWTKDEVESRPWIDGITFDQGIDCLRGEWNTENRLMTASFKSWNGNWVVCRPVIKKLPFGRYGIYINSQLKGVTNVDDKNEEIAIDLQVGAEDVDISVISARSW